MSIYWATLPLDDESIRMAKIVNVDYRTALKKDLTPKFSQRLKIIGKSSKQNLIVSTFGPQGYGKSFVNLYAIEKYSEYRKQPFTLDHVAFTITELNSLIEGLEHGAIFMLDEQIHTKGYGSRVEMEILENAEMTVRQHGLSFFFLAPKFIQHNFHYILETWCRGSEQPWDFENKTLEEQWKWTKSILYDHREHMIGYIVTGTPSDTELLKAYDKKKDEFIDKVRKGKGSDRYLIIKQEAADLLADEAFVDNFKMGTTQDFKKFLLIQRLEGKAMSTDEFKMLFAFVDGQIRLADEKRREVAYKAISDKLHVFLAENSDKAYSLQELSEQLSINPRLAKAIVEEQASMGTVIVKGKYVKIAE